MTLAQRVQSTMPSIKPQELRKYAFGVNRAPSAMTLMMASTVKSAAKPMSVNTNQFFTLNL